VKRRVRLVFAVSLITLAAAAAVLATGCTQKPNPLAGARSVVILGVDGMDPQLFDAFRAKGLMPNLERLMARGCYSLLTTSTPPQSPVAWSNFITGMNPGGHGIFDFIHCDRSNYLPLFSEALVESPKKTVRIGRFVIPLSAGRVELLRKGDAFWQLLDRKDVPYLIFKIPSNFPPVESKGISLSGMGTPDILGTYGTFSFFTDDPTFASMDVSGGQVIPVTVSENQIQTAFIGPENTLLAEKPVLQRPFTVSIDPENATAKITIDEEVILLREGDWTPWFELSFDVMGPFKKITGIVRLYLKALSPYFMLYATPININPADPALPISTPPGYAKQICRKVGYYFTQGMAEDTKALEWGVFDDGEFIEQANFVFDENNRLLDAVLDDYRGGFLFFYFSTLDQTTHMLWRDFDPDHPAHTADSGPYMKQTERYYAQIDSVVGAVEKRLPEDAVFIVMSDHGFAPYYWKFNLNTWLYQNGFIALLNESNITDQPLFRNVFWRRTRAFGLGINGLYVNLRGREAEGVVKPGEEYEALIAEISEKLLAYRDPETGAAPVKHVYRSKDVYQGDQVEIGPDLVVGFARGYRCSDESALGDFSNEIISPNLSKWTGDHCMATDEVPGILVANRPLLVSDPALTDFAATVLHLYGVERPKSIGGRPLFD
jgi:predicted AlkP superfamily phosphohydrolase/phosphomutase